MSQESVGPAQPSFRRYYLVSGLVSVVILALIGWVWYRVYTAPPAPFPGETRVTTAEEVASYLQKTVAPINTGEAPIFVPTGVVFQSVEFKGPYTLQVSGYLWQRYADSMPSDLNKGVVFPEAESTTFTKVYETRQGSETLTGWNFKATLREQFDYARYPLDRQLVWLRVWPVDFARNVYLAPDIAGYVTLDPAQLPGLDPGLVLENWEIQQSYFSYRLNHYDANFGIQGYNAAAPQPELYFNMAVKRYILTALIARLLAPVVILSQLFVIVMVIGSDTKRLEQFGVRPGAVIFTCAAFFFAILLAQNSLRDEVKAYGVVYLETVHILAYLVILGVAANSVLLVAFPNMGLFRDNDNLWVEVAYWPLIFLIVLGITLWMFG